MRFSPSAGEIERPRSQGNNRRDAPPAPGCFACRGVPGRREPDLASPQSARYTGGAIGGQSTAASSTRGRSLDERRRTSISSDGWVAGV